jgi:hypothetical protein
VLIEHVHTLLGVLGRDADELPRRSDSGERLSVLECELHVRLSNLEKLYLVARTRCGHGRKIQTLFEELSLSLMNISSTVALSVKPKEE